MKTTIITIAALAAAFAPRIHAAPGPEFFRALHIVETGGRLGPIKGDGGRALGPLQIHRAFHQDSGVPGAYENCADLDYSIRVVSAYLRRYAPRAWERADVTVLARIHNGGPQGHRKKATLAYAAKVRRALQN